MTTEQKINDFIANQEKALADFKSNLLKEINPKQEFKVGRWDYFENNNGFKFLAKHKSVDGNKVNYSLMIALDGSRSEENDWACLDFFKRPATEAEVKEALEKEWEKLGGVMGASFSSIFSEGGLTRKLTPYNSKKENFITYYYSPTTDELRIKNGIKDGVGCSNPVVYSKGKFAKIEKDEAIKIGEHKAEWINSGTILKVGCQEFCKQHVFDLRHVMETFKIHEVIIRNKTITIGTVNAILEKLK